MSEICDKVTPRGIPCGILLVDGAECRCSPSLDTAIKLAHSLHPKNLSWPRDNWIIDTGIPEALQVLATAACRPTRPAEEGEGR